LTKTADNSCMFRLIVVISIFLSFTHSLFAENVTLPGPLERNTAKVRELAATRSGSVLLAYGREARDDGRFADALTYFLAATQSVAGKKDFLSRLDNALETVDTTFEDRHAEKFLLKTGRPGRGMGYSRQTDGLFGLMLENFDDDRTANVQRFRIRFDFFPLKKPTEEGKKPQEFSVTERQLFFDAFIRELSSVLSREFPGNPLRLFQQDKYWFIEGIMNSDFPTVSGQAYLELAKTYKAQGDLLLADRYISELLNRPVLFPKDQGTGADARYESLYLRADMYQILHGSAETENVLKIISKEDPQFTNVQKTDIQPAIRSMALTLRDRGIDKALELYRFKDSFSRKAHVLIGISMFKGGNNEESLQHLGFAFVQILSTAIDEIRKSDPLYQFTAISSLLTDLENFPRLLSYLKESLFFETAYYLSQAVYRSTMNPGSRLSALNLMAVLSKRSDAGIWAERARISQLSLK